CATLGGTRIPVTRQEAETVVRAAWDAGIRYIDTAPYYGFGQAERAVGDALRDEPRDDWVLSTKVGRLLRPFPQVPAESGRKHPLPFGVAYDYSYDGIMRSFEDSLQRLGLAPIDILYVPDLRRYQHGDAHPGLMRSLRESGYRALTELKSSGTIKAIGIGVNEREVLLEAMEWGEWDAFLLAGRYTLLEQAPLDDLLPKCLERGTSLVVGGPLPRPAPGPHARPARAPVARAEGPPGFGPRRSVPLPAAALQSPLAHPAVAAIIPGPRTPTEVAETPELLHQPIPAALWDELR